MDMRWPNAHLPHIDFTMETLHKYVGLVVDKHDKMITTDIAKAYYHVRIHEDTQRYLCWQHNGKWYCPSILVFGLAPAPLVFTKIIRPILSFARGMGVKLTNIINDFLWAARKERMHEVVEMVRTVLSQLGWSFNDKCRFTPSTEVEYMGMIVDSERFEVRAPDNKVVEARTLARRLL